MRVKTLREGLGLSQEAFAERAGLAYKYYQHVEAGRKRDVRLSTLQKLAKACGLELYELFNFDAETPALAEDPTKNSVEAKPGKGGRKSGKGSASGNRA
jgi:transcriptional regulator with XRE-family HTH domain